MHSLWGCLIGGAKLLTVRAGNLELQHRSAQSMSFREEVAETGPTLRERPRVIPCKCVSSLFLGCVLAFRFFGHVHSGHKYDKYHFMLSVGYELACLGYACSGNITSIREVFGIVLIFKCFVL